MPTTLEKAVAYYEEQEPKGEYVLVLEGKSFEEQEEERIESWQDVPIEEHMKKYTEAGMDSKEAMKAVAKDRGVSKRDIYQYMVQNSTEKEER
jgi:16S rRNA (cytidine1402-2'-O)-methyltransferase